MRVAVCDDDAVVRQQVLEMVNRILEQETCTAYANGEALLQEADEDIVFDAVIMDIEWDGTEQGMRWAKKLQDVCPDARIIYLTGYTQKYVQQVFLKPSNLSGFLMKPVDEKLLRENLLKVEKEKEERLNNRLVFLQKGTICSLSYDEILYMESRAHKIHIYTADREFECWEKLENLEKALPDYFIRCHKSYLVNMKKILRFGAEHVLQMENGKTIPVSRACYGKAKHQYFTFVKANMLSGEQIWS